MSRCRFVGTGKVAERAEYVELSNGERRRSGNQAKDETTGLPLYVVDVLVDDPDSDRAEIVGVKVASHDQPRTELGKEVKFRGLVALPYVMQGTNRVALSFTAEGIEGQGKPQGQAA
ncbi:MAG: hypothetical protein ABS81_07280 [Pseudonocardia sp. SCN 72-86]|nr:MAG: hypothetical protein ABS81_07280 [Pseudonocardia sp. SCN 72-86]